MDPLITTAFAAGRTITRFERGFTHAHKYRVLQKDWAGYTLSDFTENFEKNLE